MKVEIDYKKARSLMVENQLRPNKINDPIILNLFENTQKEDFIYNSMSISSYGDLDINLDDNRGYLKNLHIAQLIQSAGILKSHKVLHVGGLRTALYNYIFAKKNSGTFVLRIEDTDQNRLIQNAAEKLINSLKIFDINCDEGPDNNELYGPYFQSQRLKIYQDHYLKLVENKKAYICIVEGDDLIPEYNPEVSLELIKKHKFVVKLKIPKKTILNTYDELRGKVEFNLDLIEDPIIIKSDGYPTYHFANVIDDHLMKITHVIRGEEWLPSLPKHILLYQYFGWDLPKFIHLPLLLNPDKSKLSKRQGDVDVDDFLKKGYLKEAIINFIALLGWHPDNDTEIFSKKSLLKNFSVKRIQKSGAIFDLKKLNWMNSLYLKNSSSNSLISNVVDILKNEKLEVADTAQLLKIIDYGKERINTLHEIIDIVRMFNNVPNNYSIIKDYNYKSLFVYWIDNLEKIDTVKSEEIKKIITNTNKVLGLSGKNLFVPLRFGLINIKHGPDLHTIINILGIDESIKRLKNGI